MSKQESYLYEFGPYRLLPQERQLLREGEPIQLTPKAFETLVALVKRAGHLAEKGELLKEVWPDSFVEESNLAQNVFALRKVLGEGENGQKYIETVPKRGYRFLASVRVVEDLGDEILVRQHVRASTMQGGPRQTTARPNDLPVPFHASVDAVVEPSASVERSDDVALRQSVSTEAPNARSAQLKTTAITPPHATAAPAMHSRSRGWQRVRLLAVLVLVAAALVGVGVIIARLFLNPSRPSPTDSIKLSRLMSGIRIWSAAVSPDGRYVAHVVENEEQSSIWVRQVSTTTDLHLTRPEPRAAYWGLTFSRDGDYLYYVKHVQGESFASLYRVPTLGGASRKLVANIFSPVTTSPDGKQIAFVRDLQSESLLIIANADGTNERQLAVRQKPNDSFSSSPRGGPSWSPDGQSIATGVISLNGGYHGEVVIVSVTDGAERPLTSHRWYQVAQVAWVSDGSGLIAAARESSTTQIWHISYPEGMTRRVTNDLSDYHGVSLTADSRVLVTVQYDRQSTITFVPEKPPSAIKRSTAGLNEGFYGLSWTPDGKLAYACEASGNLDIWLMGADGVTSEQLTTDQHHDSTPSVSPDGRSMVFLSSRNGDNMHVWRMDIDGGNQRQLTNQVSEGTPSFTPDGRWVVYSVSASGIWKVPAEGGEPVLIWGGNVHTPSVSPDGSLVACAYRDEKLERADKIALLPIGGGAPVKILDEPEDLSSSAIRWTPDGRALIYVATRDWVSNLWTLPLDGSPPHPLTNFNSDLIFNFAWSRDNGQLALARGTSSSHVVLLKDFR
jgi:Tol biopolymer transport system component/DNA-binding winged helix-turn-helix (wHTH) protein